MAAPLLTVEGEALMAAPQRLLDLLDSLRLEGIPATAPAGTLISPRIVPDLSGPANPILASLVETETLAQIVTDLKPLLNYLAKTLSIDAASVLKAVEFPVPTSPQTRETKAREIDVESVADNYLPHLIPKQLGTGHVLDISTKVEGLLGRTAATPRFDPAQLPSTVTALIKKAPVLAAIPNVTVSFRLADASGKTLRPERYYATGESTFAPKYVLAPAISDLSDSPPSPTKVSFYCDVTITYTPSGSTTQESVSRQLGPVWLDLPWTLLPVIAVLTEHAPSDAEQFPGRVLMAVP